MKAKDLRHTEFIYYFYRKQIKLDDLQNQLNLCKLIGT